MNGPAGLAYLDRRERVLKLGESFEKQPRCAFHTVRCECGLHGGCTRDESPGMCVCVGGGCGDVETDASEFSNSVPAALGSPGAPMAA